MSKRRPYIYQDREWLEIANIQERQDVQPDDMPRSELDQPWRFGNDDDDNYWTYEDDSLPCPTCGPWCPPCPTGPDPVPIPGPCDQGTGCDFLTLTSIPETIECGTTYNFTTIHVVSGCEPASFEDAFLAWSITAGDILDTTPPGMTWKAPECCDGQEVTVTVSSAAGDCSDTRTFKLECPACCEEFVVTGADTVNPATTWVGGIDPPCPGATCTVTNNSGCPMTCEVNSAGTTVSVGVGLKNCGSFTVTVTEDTSTPQKIEDNCPGESAAKTVRINGNGGFWKTCWTSSFIFCNGPFCSCTFTDGEQRWSIAIGAGIFCGDTQNTACFEDWPLTTGNIIFTKFIRASDCDTNGPCAGSSLFGSGLSYWVNPDCECI